ncbi:MAG TPA: hypothetical protein VGB73_02400 [Pyrinomonadaceae bacterium]|jgi:hypothetical protein
MKALSLKSIVLALVSLLVATSAAVADVKIKTRTTTQMDSASSAGRNHSAESTVYIKGARQRTESGGNANASILQCDLKRYVNLNDSDRTYTVMSMMPTTAGASGERTGRTGQPPATGAPRRGGVINVTNTTTDLKETKRFPQFGNVLARHYRIETVMESSPEACNQMNMRMVRDGWYADIQADFSCDMSALSARALQMTRPDCLDRHEAKNIGPAVRGYALYETTTTTMNMNVMGRSISNTYTSTTEVLEISSAPLSAALFDVPAGYTERREGGVNTSAGNDDDDDDDDTSSTGTGISAGAGGSASSGGRASNAGTNMNRTTTTSAAALGPKREGVVRIGVPLPRATAGEGLDAQTLAAAVRNSLVNALRGDAVEVAPLDAQIPALIEAEAREKQCDYILFTNVAHKKGGGGGFGGFMRKAAPVVGVVPMGGGTAGAVASTVASTAVYTAAEISSSIKAKDEITLDYRLTTAANTSTPVTTKTLKGKAKSDGDDVLSPLVEQEATAVLAVAAKK